MYWNNNNTELFHILGNWFASVYRKHVPQKDILFVAGWRQWFHPFSLGAHAQGLIIGTLTRTLAIFVLFWSGEWVNRASDTPTLPQQCIFFFFLATANDGLFVCPLTQMAKEISVKFITASDELPSQQGVLFGRVCVCVCVWSAITQRGGKGGWLNFTPF